MNKLAFLVSHSVIDDKIFVNKSKITIEKSSLGGPVTFYSKFLNSTDIKPQIITSFGNKSKKEFLYLFDKLNSDIFYNEPSILTTNYELRYDEHGNRKLKLKNLANIIQLNFKLPKAVFALVSPVYNEVSPRIFDLLAQSTNLIVLDPQGYFREANSLGEVKLKAWFDQKILSQVNILKLSQLESAFFKKKLENHEFNSLFNFQKFKILIITLGDKGSLIFFRDNDKISQWKVPAYPIHKSAIDETGAGDIFLAAFTYWYYRQKEIINPIIKATAITSLHIEKGSIHGKNSSDEEKNRITWIKERIEQIE